MSPKNPVSRSSFNFQQAGQPQFVLNDAVLDARFFGEQIQLIGVACAGRSRLLAVDMLAGRYRLLHRGNA